MATSNQGHNWLETRTAPVLLGSEAERPISIDMASFECGSLIAGRYELIDLLGVGGTASVYRVRDLCLENEVIALKLIHKKFVTEDSYLRRFRREVIIARRLSHPNIVKLYDFGELEPGLCFLTMELIEGRAIRGVIGPGLAFQRAIEILLQITLALDYAHRHGVVHRDVKPDNVLLRSDGVIKLTDFGTAREMELDRKITPEGNVMGSPYYMAPERFRNGALSNLGDLYALGVLAFEMVTGQLPFRAENYAALIGQHMTHTVPAVASFRSDVPSWFQEVVETCLEKNPQDRFGSVSELAGIFFENLCAMGAVPPLECIPESLVRLARPKSKGRFAQLFSF